jgi:hypothetical protein
MKIALLHLYSNVPTGGEYTYAIHLQSGLKKLGHECDIVVESKSGRTCKNQKDKGFRVVKKDMMKSELENYDYVIVISGYLNGGDYSVLESNKFKIAYIEHNYNRSYKRYLYNDLIKIRPDVKIFSAGKPSVRIYKTFTDIPVHFVRLPFDIDLMKLKIQKKEITALKAVFPHRMSSVKKPEFTYRFFDSIGDIIEWSLDFYGSYTESIILWSMSDMVVDNFFDKTFTKANVAPYIFKNKNIRILPAYNPQSDLPEVYSNYNLTVHSTKCRNDGARMEYVLLESIYYDTPIMSMKKNWVDNVPYDDRDELWVENEAYIDMTIENIQKFANDMKFREEVLDRQKQILKLYDATEIARKFIEL